jgi:site-specific recombinase XerD
MRNETPGAMDRITTKTNHRGGIMNALTVTNADSISVVLIESCLNGLAPNTRRAYQARIRNWLHWSKGAILSRQSVKQHIRALELSGASAQVRNQALAALKKLAREALELDLMDAVSAGQIDSIRTTKASGIRTGCWLTVEQAKALLLSVDRTTIIGKRDAAALALLMGAGLRRDEVCQIRFDQLNWRAGCQIQNLIGKGNRVRTIKLAPWGVDLLKDWIHYPSADTSPFVMRSFHNGAINGSLSPAAVRDIVRHYGSRIGLPDLNPHDLRRTFAKLARAGGAQLETIQRSLGHASLRTTEIYLESGEAANAGDFIQL